MLDSATKGLRSFLGRLLRGLGSLKLTVFCLALLFVLVGWGTLHQVDHGLYASQKRFFHSWFFLAFGVVPFPGAQAVSWLLGANLLSAALLKKFRFKWNKLGILCIHYGLFLLLVGAFMIHQFAQESYLPLYEGELSNLSHDYNKWELALWTEQGSVGSEVVERVVHAVDVSALKTDEAVRFAGLHVELVPRKVFDHSFPIPARSLVVSNAIPLEALDTEKLVGLREVAAPSDPAKAFPGLSLEVRKMDSDQPKTSMVLWGGADGIARMPMQSAATSSPKDHLYVQLRRKRYSLPVRLKLLSFERGFYQGANIPKSYESFLEVFEAGIKRNVRVFMNNPLRLGDLTFYQASFNIDDGTEQSILAVVNNKGRLLPYVSGGAIAIGLLLHFAFQLVRRTLRHGDR